MEWDRLKVGSQVQLARMQTDMNVTEAAGKMRMKPTTLSAIENGILRRVPTRATQRKIEELFGIELDIPRDDQKTVCIYVPHHRTHIIQEARTKWPDHSQSEAILLALEEWSEHQKALAHWKEHHMGQI